MVNIAYALLGALKVSVKETKSTPGDLKSSAVEKVIQELLHVRIFGNQSRLLAYTNRSSLFFPILMCEISPAKPSVDCVMVPEMPLLPPKSTTLSTKS